MKDCISYTISILKNIFNNIKFGYRGKNVYVSKSAYIFGKKKIFLNDDVKIMESSTICAGDYLPKNNKFIPQSSGEIHIDKESLVFPYSMIISYGGIISIGHNCTINPFVIVYGDGGVKIGNYVRIAAQTMIIAANHNYKNANELIINQGYSKKGIIIGNDVWIGAGVKILDGVQIGNGAVIGAGSVVTKNIEPYSINVGNPSEAIGKRV